jgi:hypothetical protein
MATNVTPPFASQRVARVHVRKLRQAIQSVRLSARWIALSQALLAVRNTAAGPATSNDNVANDDRCPAVSPTPAPAGYFVAPGFFLRPPIASL